MKYSRNYRLHIELEARTDLKDLVTFLRNNNFRINTIERNAAYANSGLSVYTVNILRLKGQEKNKFDLITEIKALPYVNFVEELM